MAAPYPPILLSQRESIPSGQTGLVIQHTLPRGITIGEIGHVQVLIRRQLTNESWAVQNGGNYSPDREVIYLPSSEITPAIPPTATTPGSPATINVPATATQTFVAGPAGQSFTIQIRFGEGPLWYGPGGTSQTFSAWRTAQIAARGFGEWSNTQRMFVFQGPRDSLFLTPTPTDSLLAGLNWAYSPLSIDPLAEAQITYWYDLPDGGRREVSKNVSFVTGVVSNGGASGTVELNVSRHSVAINYAMTLITVNNTILFRGTRATPIEIPIFPFDNDAEGGLTRRDLIGEELDDGAIIVRVNRPGESSTPIRTFQINLFTLDGIMIDSRVAEVSQYEVRDFTIEMGEQYGYIAIRGTERVGGAGHMLRARNMNFNANTFLASKRQQLRVSGNVSVNNFNRVTSDQITQTIGGKYPFYSRAGAMNYRVLSLSGVISLRLDPTRTFLNLSSSDNSWWNSDLVFRHKEDRDIILRRSDLFGEVEVSRNRRRYTDEEVESGVIQEPGPLRGPIQHAIPNRIDEADPPQTIEPNPSPGLSTPVRVFQQDEKTPGPVSIYSDYLGRDTTLTIDTDVSVSIYAERKFREVVMKWLTDGSPKLFRSETEGNMIVMLTGISFSPFRGDRLLYNFSATLTEIAEYNTHNLQLYDLIPADFIGHHSGVSDFIEGSEDPNLPTNV